MVTVVIKQLRLVLMENGSWQGEVLTDVEPDAKEDKKIFGRVTRSLSVEASADSMMAFLDTLEATSLGDWPEDVLPLPIKKKK